MEDSTEPAKDAGLEDASTPGCRDAADTLAHLANAFKAGLAGGGSGDGDASAAVPPAARWVGKPMMSKRGSSSKEAEATPDKKRRKTESLPVADTPKQSRTTPSQQVQADSHFIVHLFVTAIAGGKLQQGLLPQKTWDVLHQVVTKVSKEQNTTVTLHGVIHEFKMRVFVCNSVEARAVGEYITMHPEQTPAPFIVLARQLSMAIAYNSASLDPSQAAVADRLRKQAKTRAVKEMREAVRECQGSITHAMLKGHCGAMAPIKELEPQLLKKSSVMDLEGDPMRRYFVFAAKNRSREDSDKVKQDAQAHAASLSSPASAFVLSPKEQAAAAAVVAAMQQHQQHLSQPGVSELIGALLKGRSPSAITNAESLPGATPGDAAGAGTSSTQSVQQQANAGGGGLASGGGGDDDGTLDASQQHAGSHSGRKPEAGAARAGAVTKPPSSPARQPVRHPGSPLSPGGRDGAAALLSLFNAVSATSSSAKKKQNATLSPLQQQQHAEGADIKGEEDGGANVQAGASPTKEEHGMDEDEDRDEADASGSGGSSTSVKKVKVERGGGKMSLAAQAAANVLRTPVGGEREGGWGGGTPRSRGALAGPEAGDSFDVSSVVMKFADSPTYKARSLKISVDLPPVLELSPALKTPRTVSTSKAGQSLYAAVKAGDLDAVRRLLAESDETSQSQLQRAISTMPDDFYSDSSNNSNLVPGCQVEIDVGGKWLEGTVLKVESGKVHVHMSGTAMGGAAFDQWVDLQEECIRPPSEGGLHGFTPLMCACSLEDGERAREIVELLLEKGADVAAMDNLGNTCVHWAAMAGHAEVIRLVASGGRGKGGAPREGKGDGEGDEEKEDLKRGDINLQTSSTGDTPLLLAARSGHSNVVRVLLEIGADVCVRNHERFGIIELAGERRQQSSELREGVLDAALELKPSLRTLVLCSKADSAQQGVSGKGGESVEDKRTGAIMGLVRDMPKHRVCIGAKKYSPASEQDMAGEGVWASAREAADVACHAVDEVMGGRARNAFCCVPDSYLGSGSGSSLQAAADASAASAVLKSAPAASEAQEVSSCPSPDSVAGTGHQVAPARPVECAAVAALHALNAHKGSVSKVAIVDLDARHCAGTEEWVRGMEVPGRVLLCSSHVVVSDEGGAGAIAGAGGAGDGVVGAGRFDDLRKFIVNEPLHPLWKQAGGKRGSSQREVGKRHIGSGRIECREQITRRVVPCLRAFCPDIVILVVGFNGLSGDSGNPSSGGADGIDFVDEDYYWMTQQVVRVASVCCEGRLVSILKGGEGVKDDSNGVATRDYRELAGAAAQHLRALTGY